MVGVGHERLARSRVVVAGAVTGIVVLVPLPVHAGTPLYHAAVQYAAGSQPRSVVTVDVNGDGRLDVVSANAGDGSVSVFTGTGDGTLVPATSIASGSRCSSARPPAPSARPCVNRWGPSCPACRSVTSTETTTPTSSSVSSQVRCWCCSAARVPPSALPRASTVA